MDAAASVRILAFSMRVPNCPLAVLFFAALFSFPTPVLPGAVVNEQPEVRLKFGDDARWANPLWDEQGWMKITLADAPARAGIYWIRVHLTRPDPATWQNVGDAWVWSPQEGGRPIDSIGCGLSCAYDLYWDGRFIMSVGQVGHDRVSEVPGPLSTVAHLPPDLLGPGEHVAAFRISSFHYNFPGRTKFRLSFLLSNYDWRSAREDGKAIVPLLGLGGAVGTAILCLLLYWFVEQRRPLLWCGFYSLSIAGYFLAVGWTWISAMLFRPVTYDLYYPSLLASDVALVCGGGCLVGMFLEQFKVALPAWWLVGFGALEIAAFWASPSFAPALWLIRGAFGMSALVSVWSLWQRRPGAMLALVVSLVGLLLIHPEDSETTFVLGPTLLLSFGLTALALLAIIGRQIQQGQRVARATQLTAARLEIELLKKNIQPHFLLNTLTVLSEIVEQDPAAAVRLIEDLAEVFRSLARLSGERLITLAQELELCRAHLRVMSLRTGREWRLETEGVDLAHLVPPGLFLTLTENGFSHQAATRPGGAFVLRQAALGADTKAYTFVSPGDPLAPDPHREGGTGLRYVRARLEESFPGRWRFRDGATSSGWESVIEIPATT